MPRADHTPHSGQDYVDFITGKRLGPDPVVDSPHSSRLVLEIEIPDFNVDGVQETLEQYPDVTLFHIVTEEWMREMVGVTFVTIPGEKSLNSDFEIHSRVCRVVGARLSDV